MNNELFEYYEKRASEYEKIYAKPERQDDLVKMREMVTQLLQDQDVLELACGTGYWTAAYSSKSKSTLATDISPASLEMARTKKLDKNKVRLAIADLQKLVEIEGHYSAVFAGFWWSHIPISEINLFLFALRQRFVPGCRCLFIDNRYVEGSSTPVCETDSDGNSYQLRALADGSQHKLLKNFPTKADLFSAVSDHATEINIVELKYYWLLSFRLV